MSEQADQYKNNLYHDLSPEYRDDLTGLPNRKWLDSHLEYQVTNYPGKFALLFIDLDDFKPINDTLGHDAGDLHLITAANAINHNIRSENDPSKDPRALDRLAIGGRSVVRWGGDEFVVLLPGISSPGDMLIVEGRVRDELAKVDVEASMGGRVHERGESPSHILKAADEAMYINKNKRKVTRREAKIASLSGRKKAAFRISETLSWFDSELKKRHGVK